VGGMVVWWAGWLVSGSVDGLMVGQVVAQWVIWLFGRWVG